MKTTTTHVISDKKIMKSAYQISNNYLQMFTMNSFFIYKFYVRNKINLLSQFYKSPTKCQQNVQLFYRGEKMRKMLTIKQDE